MTPKTALISDIHGNSPALRAVLADIQRENCAELLMLGDIVNGLAPHDCVTLLRDWGNANQVKISCIKGNAEAYLLTPNRAAMPRQDEAWNRDMLALVQWFEDQLSESDLAWIASFPATLRWQDAELVHDSPLDRLLVQSQSAPDILPIYREWFFHGHGIKPDMPEAEWQKLLAYMETENLSHVFSGHTHVPFARALGERVVCNLGSAGAPLDGDPRPSWVLLDGDSAPSIRRVEYDIALIHQLIDATPDYPDFKMPGFQQAYKTWFATGIHWKAHLPNSARKQNPN
jgi:predicted phosphodiesterase